MVDDFQCRSCEARAGELVLDLGEQPLANNFLSLEDRDKFEPIFPLRLAVCTKCWLLQLTDLISPAQLFSEYVYFSSYSNVWVKHAKDCSIRYLEEFALDAENFVVEIASNDGYLLRNFAEAGIPHLGIEPAENVATVARKKGVQTRVDFFSEKLAKELAMEQQADLIIAYNVFAHVPDINDFVAGLKCLLAPEGRVILEFPYAAETITNGEFDTVYHEHVFYFTLCSLQPIFDRHDLRITTVERTPLHGGSLRLFVRQENHEADETVAALLAEEKERGVMSLAFYQGFSDRAERIRNALREQITTLLAEDKTIAAYGAAAKGTILLNYCRLDTEQIAFVVDRSPHKQGRLMPGVHVPIVSADELAGRVPEVTLLLAWNFMDEILGQQIAYRNAGGQFLIPIPKVRLL